MNTHIFSWSVTGLSVTIKRGVIIPNNSGWWTAKPQNIQSLGNAADSAMLKVNNTRTFLCIIELSMEIKIRTMFWLENPKLKNSFET